MKLIEGQWNCTRKRGEWNGKGKLDVPVWEKMNLTVEEAAAYSNIGINKIDEMAKSPNCSFVLYIGRKKLIKRKEFEQYIAKSVEI